MRIFILKIIGRKAKGKLLSLQESKRLSVSISFNLLTTGKNLVGDLHQHMYNCINYSGKFALIPDHIPC